MADIWANHVLDDYELEPLDGKTIEKVERKLGVTFPVSYIKLLKVILYPITIVWMTRIYYGFSIFDLNWYFIFC